MDKFTCIAIACLVLVFIVNGLNYYKEQERQELQQQKINTLQEKIDDMIEQHAYEQTIREREKYIENNLFIFSYYTENNTINLMTLASANGTVQVKIAPPPGIYPTYDNITIETQHRWMFEHTESLEVQQINNTIWRWNESTDDTTEHWFQITNASLDEYVVYVTKEVEPLDGYYFMPKQKEYIIKINRR